LPCAEGLTGAPELESRRRLEILLRDAEGPLYGPKMARGLRAVETLGWMAGPEAERLLKALAGGLPKPS